MHEEGDLIDTFVHYKAQKRYIIDWQNYMYAQIEIVYNVNIVAYG